VPSILLIVNPVAGRGRVQKHWPRVENALRKAGIDFDAVTTQAPYQATEIAAQAPQKYSTVVCIGGDGTNNEIVNGLMRASGEGETISVGVVPLGNGDDFAKMIPPEAPLGGRPFSWQDAVRKITRGETKLLDVGRIRVGPARLGGGGNSHYFANGMSIGFSAQGAFNTTRTPRIFKGLTAYIVTALWTLLNYPSPTVRIQLDDKPPFEQLTAGTMVMNGRSMGNGFWVTPDARADDGWLDVLVFDALDRVGILRILPKLIKGTHLNEPVLRLYQARRVVIESSHPMIVETDGEIPYQNADRLEAVVLPKKLRVLT